MTEWRPVPEWEEIYEINREGQIRNKLTKKLRKVSEDDFGWPIVYLRYKGRRGKRRPDLMRNRVFPEDQSVETRPVGVAA